MIRNWSWNQQDWLICLCMNIGLRRIPPEATLSVGRNCITNVFLGDDCDFMQGSSTLCWGLGLQCSSLLKWGTGEVTLTSAMCSPMDSHLIGLWAGGNEGWGHWKLVFEWFVLSLASSFLFSLLYFCGVSSVPWHLWPPHDGVMLK